MPLWVLRCVKCNQDFEYSQIDDVGYASLYLPLKPEVGSASVCPNCGHKAAYKRTDLRYSASKSKA